MAFRSRASLVMLGPLAVVTVAAAPVFAHVELQPDTGTAGETVTVTLSAENERADVGVTKVQLHFPEDQLVRLSALPAVAGWTTSVAGGKIGQPVADVFWSRDTATPDDVSLPVTLGPLPNSNSRLQFKVVQTYSNGDVDRWIEEWAEGAPEPEFPGPIFEVTGAVAVPATAAPSTLAPTTTTTVVSEPPTSTSETSNTSDTGEATDTSDDSNTGVLLATGAAVVVVGGGTALLLSRRRSRS